MPAAGRQRAVAATGELLRQLMKLHSSYRRQWESAGRRFRSNEPSHAAIAQLIAEYLWEIGERPDSETDLPRRLRDRIRRALRGEQISGETLNWFIGAFDMSDEDSTKLWAAFSGDDATSMIEGITDTVYIPRPMAKRQWHRTITLFEKYYFARDRSYFRRHTLQIIQAIEDGVDSYLYNHEPYATHIRVLYGGKLGTHYEYGDGLVSDDIMLGRALRTGQRIAVEYETSYGASANFPTEVRRAVRARVENLDFAIQFDQENPPTTLWFSVWSDHYLGDPVRKEPLTLDAHGAAHRFVAFAQQTVLGFSWQW